MSTLEQYITIRTDAEFTDTLGRLFPEEFKIREGEKKLLTKTVSFQVTDDCCMACSYCYQICKQHHKMDFEQAKKFLDLILDLDNPCDYINPTNSPGIILDFIGGEPFMNIKLIDQICTYFTEQLIEKNHPWLFRHRFSICSNGLLYFEPEVQAFFHKFIGRISFSISIDGNKELHDSCRVDLAGNGTYDRAMKAVNHFRDYFHGSMGSKMTLAPGNITYTKEAVVSLIENGYDLIHLNCVYEEGWTNKHANILYYQLKSLADYMIEHKYYRDHYLSIFNFNNFKPKDPEDNDNWCGGVDNFMIAVDYKGDIYPCIRYMESSLGTDQKPVIIGNTEHGVYVTEEEKEWKKELVGVTRKNQSTEECFNCPIAEGCAWCSAYNYQKFGTVKHRATFICPMHKATSLANAYYWNKVCRDLHLQERFKIYCPREWALEIIPEKEWDLLKTLELSY